MKANFIIAGCPKCGTSSMWYYLKQHPQIFMAADKEPHFYAKDLLTKYYKYKNEEYYDLFNDAREKVVGEASTIYFYSKVAPNLIKEDLGKNTKILLMLRNPIEMMYSFHSQRIASGSENVMDFEEALSIDKIRSMGAMEYRIVPYKEVASYDKHTKKWIDTFGKENVKVVIFEEFLKDNGKTFREILEFLEVDSDFIPSFDVMNENNTVRSIFLRNLLRDSVRLPLFLQKTIKLFIPHKIRKGIRNANDKKVKRNPMSMELRERLVREMKPGIQRLEKVLNKKLNVWSK